MSDLRSLYTAIAGWNIIYTNEAGTSITVAGKDLSAVYEEIAVCPTRILVPWRNREGSAGGGLKLMTVGSANVAGVIRWNIADLYLHLKVGEKTRLAYVMPDLVRYAGAYAEKVADSGADAGIGTMTLLGLSLGISVIEWPVGSGNRYYGVEALLNYEEMLNPT